MIPTSLDEPTFVVAIGASTGGVEALTQFFEQVPADSDLAYVVILHLSPDYDSQLTQILENVACIPVTQVTERMQVEANQVYVVPPNQHLQMDDGAIVVRENAHLEDRRAPVDIFFRTLAESRGPQAIAVILSGTGANGSMGLKRVKEKGGAVFVQNPREAAYNEMPRHAIATNLVDDILPVAQLPARLIAYRRNLGTVAISEEPLQRPEDQQQALREIFTQLRTRTGHDFSNYKRSTLLRRLERRISIYSLPSLPAYTAFLREHPEETQALLKDLLISVTNFFRDQPVFTHLEQYLMPLLTQPGKETVRIWVAGCATGEEAYSLAMQCAELTIDGIDAPKVQIFATDIDQDAIAIAREGLYTLNDAADVSSERLSRFFTPEGQQYRIRREIREMILFAHHNVLRDPPFSQLDLVSCRNLMIYFNTVAQERVMETFHFALKPGGYLLLGMSETADGSSDLYAMVNREYHLYQSRQVSSRPYAVPESIPQLPQPRKRSPEPTVELDSRPMLRMNYGDLHQQLLEQYAPPSIIVNEEYDILHISERAGRYLQIGGGEPSKSLLKLIRPELRLELRTALYQATQQQIDIDVHPISLAIGDQTETLILHVRPVVRENDPARGFALVLFEPTHEGAAVSPRVLTSAEPMARQLEEELIRVKAQLRSANEYHELQAEELKASNEELQAMNEELRSAAEELETGKEELQAINEELTTVNQELKVKIEEVMLASNNLQNLTNSTNIATLFLDRGFRLKLFTPATREIFNLIASDVGRPLFDVTNRLDYPYLMDDTITVLETLQPIEREVNTTDGRTFILRVLPYRTTEDRISGLILTFVDITDRIGAEQARLVSEEQFRLFVTASSSSIYKMSADWQHMLNLQGAAFLADTDDPNSNWLEKYILQTDQPQVLSRIEQSIANKQLFEFEHRIIRVDGTIGWAFSRAIPLLNAQGEIIEWFGAASDITERKAAEEALRQSEEKYRTLFNSMDEGVGTIGLIFDENQQVVDYEYFEQNPAFERLTGLPGNVVGKRVGELIPNLEPFWFDLFGRVAKTGEPHRVEHAVAALDRWFDVYVSRIGGEGSRTIAYIYNNITERKKKEQREAVLAEITKELIKLDTIEETMEGLGQTIGRYFGVRWCVCSELINDDEVSVVSYGWHDQSVPSLKGTYQMRDYFTDEQLAKNKAGELTSSVDTQTDPTVHGGSYGALGIRAFITVPMARDRQGRFQLSIMDNVPRAWQEEDVKLIKEIATRIWTRLERARAEESLRESEARLASIRPLTLLGQTEELAQVGSWEYHRSTGQFNWSDGMYRLFGLKPGQAIQPESYLDFALEQDREKAQDLVTYLKSGQGVMKTDLRIQVGTLTRTLRIKAEVIGEAEQERVLGVDLNITDQLTAQQQMQQTVENLQAVLDASPASIGLLKAIHDEQNPDSIIDFRLAVGNDKLAQFFNQPLSELLGQSAERFGTLLWNGRTLDILRQVYHDQEYRYEEKALFAPDQERWLAISVIRQDGGVVLTGLDITELKQVQTQQQQWLIDLEALQHSADALVALRTSFDQRKDQLRTVSHDLRSNLGIVQGALHLLNMANTESDRAQMMEMVLRNVKHATDLLTNLLDLARLEAGQQKRNLESFDAAQLLKELGQSFRPMANARRLQLTLAGPETLLVENDRRLVYRMIQNLTINALKYTQRGSVSMDWGQHEDRWWFDIVDTGPGFDQALVARLNTNEHDQNNHSPAGSIQAESIQTGSIQAGPGAVQGPGEGIGLRIVRELASLLEARFQVSSEAGVGTRFRVDLPLRYL